MTRTQFPPNRRTLPSLILLAQIVAFGCASKVQLGETTGMGGNSSMGGTPAAGGATSSTSAGTAATTGGATSTFQKLANRAITGIDLLLMIDNSSSMADKQATLAAAVPQLLVQLVQPACVDANGAPIAGQRALLGANPPCAQGTPEFNPINNIHIGVISSSLGDHGSGTSSWGLCFPGAPTSYTDASGPIIQPPDVNDMGHLMGTLARGAAAASDPTTTNANISASQGFLAWGALNLPPPSNTDLTAATKIFKDLVAATAEKGCGLESQLESWFRFLIDPVPPIFPLQPPDASGTHRQGSDDVLLAQRAAFLRPDSLVAIVMLTDENDCSLRDTDVGYVAARTDMSILGGSPMCATNPNDKCCYSCTASPPAGCPACASPAPAAVDDGPYQANLRCWQQKRRFGYEFMYPTSRYVVGLTKKVLCPDQSFGDMDCDCEQAHKLGAGCNPGSRQLPNPLYSNTVGVLNNGQGIVGYPNAIPRTDNSNVLLAGIVGVPWQDISEPQSQAAGVALNYIPVSDARWTDPNGIWSTIYGDDSANIVPADVHMVESVVPRAGLPGPTAATNADSINGHEYTTAFQDLEYACTYRLPASRACACNPGSTDYAACVYKNPNDCCNLTYTADGRGGPGGTFSKPLCNGNSQESAKAYPGLREIAVLHDYALLTAGAAPGNSIVASICPKDLTPGQEASPGYGYNPAVAALIDSIKVQLQPLCLPTPINVNASTGTVPCSAVEVVSAATVSATGMDCASYCTSKGRTSPSVAAAADLRVAMQQSGLCDVGSQPACDSLCKCQLQQEIGANLTTCQNATDGSQASLPPGFCYVDPSQGVGSQALVAGCPTTHQAIVRYVGNNISAGAAAVPLAGAYVFMSCQ
jgi:hypothetical protein